jgi:hypothetical protein
MNASGGPSVKQLVLVPAVITLAVTLLRLVGELQSWSPLFFNRAAGGGGAIVGISWLVIVFGVYFALKLVRAGQGPSGAGRAIGFGFLGMAIATAIGFSSVALTANPAVQIWAFVVGSVVAIPVAFRGWPALAKTLFAYAFAARIPVAVVMLFAIMGDWGTHYDAPPPNFPPTSPFMEWLLTGLVPQLTIWIYVTVVGGMIVGGIAAALAGKRVPAPA